MVRRWLLTTLLALGGLGVVGTGPEAVRIVEQACGAATAGEHRAVVIVDTGAQVRRVCVRFSEDSITGREALVRAGVDPVFKDYGGKGAFVCKLLDTGCPASECPCDTSEYWVYSRARAGSSTFTVSSLGVSSTTVRDGDVEGWRWSTGGTPAYASPDAVCGPKPATATTTAAAAGGGSTTTTAVPRPTGGAGATGARSGQAATGAPGAAPGASTTTVPSSAAAEPAFDPGLSGEIAVRQGTDPARVSMRSTDATGSRAAGVAGFAVASGVILSTWLAARAARRRRVGTP